jgi:hypothetical protein
VIAITATRAPICDGGGMTFAGAPLCPRCDSEISEARARWGNALSSSATSLPRHDSAASIGQKSAASSFMRVSSVTSFFANSRFSGECWFLSLSDVLSEDAVLYAASSSSLTLRLNTNGRCRQAEDDQLSSEGKMAELIVQDLAETMDIKAIPKEGEP